jgi:acyl-CoA thioesterase
MTLDVTEQIIERIRQDPYCHRMGLEILEVRKGYSKVSMQTSEDMVNFHGIVHGGVIFSLADAAFAAASNSQGMVAVALNMEISYRRAVKPKQRLFAEAREESLGGKTALYHITVSNEDGLVACCHGNVYRKNEIFPSPGE